MLEDEGLIDHSYHDNKGVSGTTINVIVRSIVLYIIDVIVEW